MIPVVNADVGADIRSSRRPAAFFDRDGVINVDHGYVHTADRFDLVRGAADALRLCRQAGYLVFVVTNQAGVARGYYDETAIAALHDHMRQVLAGHNAFIDDIRYCPHHPEGVVPDYTRTCSWRKPDAGMILDLIRQWQVDPTGSFMIGDKDSDMEAARNAGITGHLFASDDLGDFVRSVIDRKRRDSGQ